MIQNPTFASWAVAWLIIISAFWGLNKSRWGHTILYAALWGLILYLVVTHYHDIETTFQNAGLLSGPIIPTGGIPPVFHP
jgi:hypothetical protein